MKIKIPDNVSNIMEALKKRGYEAYVVGGCVRDSLLGITPKDWDITTNATPENMKDAFCDYHVIPTGERYGTLTVLLSGNPYEVTTYRADGQYSDGRRPDSVAFSNELADDLCRRDFTINAMAYHPDSGLVDRFGGRSDINERVVRCVGNPKARFDEDALRIMRAVRFAVKLDFDVEKETGFAIFECGENLKNVSQERKREELVKILRGVRGLRHDTPHYQNLCRMTEYIIKRVIPEFRELAQTAHNSPYHYTDVFTHTMEMVFAADTDDIELLLSALFHDIGKMKARIFDEQRLTNHFYNHAVFSVEISKEIMERLRFDGKTIEHVLRLIEVHDVEIKVNRQCAKKLLNQLGHEMCLKLLKLQLLDKAAHRWSEKHGYQSWAFEIVKIRDIWLDILQSNEAFRLGDLAITGRDLVEIGFAQGQKLGEALASCLEYVIENPEQNNRNALLAYVSSHSKTQIEKLI